MCVKLLSDTAELATQIKVESSDWSTGTGGGSENRDSSVITQ